MHLSAWLLLLAILIGNCGLWLFCFNRINATGINRHVTKFVEKAFIAACFLIPTAIFLAEHQQILAWLTDPQSSWWPRQTTWLFSYGIVCLASLLILGTLWLESRIWLIPPKQQLSLTSTVHAVDKQVEGGSPADRLTRFLCDLPGSDIGYLDVTHKHLRLPRPVAGIDEFSLGHISDLHFTGQYRPQHYQFVLDRFMELSPAMIVISGDIIDYDKCLPWIEPLLGRLHAPLGVYFVLGNHDRRVSDVARLVSQLESLGLTDLGRQTARVALPTGSSVELIGNELPWLRRQPLATVRFSQTSPTQDTLRVAVSHAPDQINWARRLHADLLLAGHTHGGQVRFPGIGPIVAPSIYGSKFASGIFYRPPTLMHVSRGIAGTHPLRWRCKPEVSLLTFDAA